MKSITIILAVLIMFVGGVAVAGEIDGKGLECHEIPATKYPEYWIFEKGHAFQVFVRASSPPKIIKYDWGEYETKAHEIYWRERQQSYSLNRKNLNLSDRDKNQNCVLKSPTEIIKIRQKEVDEINKKMKKNKI